MIGRRGNAGSRRYKRAGKERRRSRRDKEGAYVCERTGRRQQVEARSQQLDLSPEQENAEEKRLGKEAAEGAETKVAMDDC